MPEANKRSESRIRAEIKKRLELAQKLSSGEYGKELPDEKSLDSEETFSGPILDLNATELTDEERQFALDWIQENLGSKPEDTPIKAKYKSPDGITNVVIYDVEIGENWYLSRWQNSGEQASFIFWPEEVYEWQLESGYQKVELLVGG